MRKIISGGVSETEIRKFLQKRGISVLMSHAGMIPQKTNLVDDLPMFYLPDWPVYNTKEFHWFDTKLSITCVIRWLKCTEPLCFHCREEIIDHTNMYKARINLHYSYAGEKCCLCDGICDDSIPF
jgi:hypothetical protein